MKQFETRLLFTALATVVLLANGCTKGEPIPNAPDRTQITPLVALGASGVEAEYASAAQTKGVESGNSALNLYFARADETAAGTYGNYAAAALAATRPAGASAQKLSFSTAQYYRADGLKTKLTGWYPGGATAAGDASGNGYYDGTARTVSWTIDGQQDVMTAVMQQGSWNNAMPSMTFEHRLSQLQFHPYAESQAIADSWGKIARIEVLNQQNTVVYNLTDDAAGTVSFSGNAKNNFSAGIDAAGAALSISTTANKAIDAKQMGNPVMIVPQSSSNYTLTLRIITSKNKYKDVTLTQALDAGTPYRLYMRFESLDITITASVAQWSNATTSDKMGDVRVGDAKDGGIVYWIDPADATSYKVFSLDQGAKTWAAKGTYVIGSGGQSDTDGRGNVAAMKAYSANTGTNSTSGVFATDFPAAEFCDAKNTGGVTGWYLPAKSELVALSLAYKDNTTVLKDAITANHGTAMASGSFWSSTEYSGLTSYAWSVDFSNSLPGVNGKGNNLSVRCVRDITPPPAVGDYYFTDGSYSPKLESGKTANGVIYWVDGADPTKFKVVALDQYSVSGSPAMLKWAESNSYVIGAGAQSYTDGRANAAAIKSAFDNKKTTAGVEITELTFEEAFPAAAYCYNYQGKGDAKGTWYLPAKTELQYLWCAFNGKAPISWVNNTNSATLADATAQGVFNDYLTAAGGTDIPDSGNLWSSTEYSSNPNGAWFVNFSLNGFTDGGDLSNNIYVRCVRDL